MTNNLAGGNFAYSTANQRKGHNVIDLTAADASNATQEEGGATIYGAPPGNAHASHHDMDSGVFSVSAAFDAFTCAGARGCHGTRSQLLSGNTVDNGTANNFEGVRRTGIAAISGAHHNSYDGAKTSDGYVGDGAGHGDLTTIHDGQMVADGYRFIPGLQAYGNEVDRWKNVDENSHNEYFATAGNTVGESAGCGVCHLQATTVTIGGTPTWGLSARAGFNSTMPVPGNDMSGFCGTCHGVFHSAGTGDANEGNGTSGAFLRHPSDWVIPNSGEYAAYTSYDVTAPVARPSVLTAADPNVNPGTDMVMCLSCHAAHATANDYMLRFDYSAMTAGGYGTIALATAEGGCLACHTTKGVLPELR
jgi:predicted CXXCH cytochrome family protein